MRFKLTASQEKISGQHKAFKKKVGVMPRKGISGAPAIFSHLSPLYLHTDGQKLITLSSWY